MAKTAPKGDLQEIIGYRFRDACLLDEALTHSSFARETGGNSRDNERLEFLGDAVLNFVVSSKLADAFPEHSEGSLSRAKARLTGAEHLSSIACSLDLSSYLRLGRGEEKSGGRFKARLAVNAVESLVAALYRDGGMGAAEEFISRFVMPSGLRELEAELTGADDKSALQEWLQRLGEPLPCYRVISESGPEHHKIFVVEASAHGAAARGKAATKKVAEQHAARALLRILKGRQDE